MLSPHSSFSPHPTHTPHIPRRGMLCSITLCTPYPLTSEHSSTYSSAFYIPNLTSLDISRVKERGKDRGGGGVLTLNGVNIIPCTLTCTVTVGDHSFVTPHSRPLTPLPSYLPIHICSCIDYPAYSLTHSSLSLSSFISLLSYTTLHHIPSLPSSFYHITHTLSMNPHFDCIRVDISLHSRLESYRE